MREESGRLVVPAKSLIDGYTRRLGDNKKGLTVWTPLFWEAFERLMEGLKSLDPDELVGLDADQNRDPIAIFIRESTGETIGKFPNEHRGDDAYKHALDL